MLFDQTNGQQRGGSTGVNVLLGALYFTIRLLPFEEPHCLSAVSEDQMNLLKCPQSAQIRYFCHIYLQDLYCGSPPCFEIATGSPAPFSLTSQLSAYRINTSINESHEIIGHSIEPTLCLLKVVVHCLNLSSVPVKINHQTFLKL